MFIVLFINVQFKLCLELEAMNVAVMCKLKRIFSECSFIENATKIHKNLSLINCLIVELYF